MLCREPNKGCTDIERTAREKSHIVRAVSAANPDSRGRLAVRRIPTLLEVERRHVLHTLHLCENNRSLTAKVLGLSVRGLRIKLRQYEKVGFAIPVPHAGNEVCGDVNMVDSIQSRELPEDEAATINVIEELISVVEAIGERAPPDDAGGGQTTRRKQKI